jgi:hypothetical protein
MDVQTIIERGLEEDLKDVGDLTTQVRARDGVRLSGVQATIREDSLATASFLVKEDGVLAGTRVAEAVFATVRARGTWGCGTHRVGQWHCSRAPQVDPSLTVAWTRGDGDSVRKGEVVGTVTGRTHAIVIGERLALNIMQRMSGVATATRRMVDAVGADRAARPPSAAAAHSSSALAPGRRQPPRQDSRHAQDCARPPRAGQDGRAHGRWHEPPHRAVRHGPHQGRPRRAAGPIAPPTVLTASAAAAAAAVGQPRHRGGRRGERCTRRACAPVAPGAGGQGAHRSGGAHAGRGPRRSVGPPALPAADGPQSFRWSLSTVFCSTTWSGWRPMAPWTRPCWPRHGAQLGQARSGAWTDLSAAGSHHHQRPHPCRSVRQCHARHRRRYSSDGRGVHLERLTDAFRARPRHQPQDHRAPFARIQAVSVGHGNTILTLLYCWLR